MRDDECSCARELRSFAQHQQATFVANKRRRWRWGQYVVLQKAVCHLGSLAAAMLVLYVGNTAESGSTIKIKNSLTHDEMIYSNRSTNDESALSCRLQITIPCQPEVKFQGLRPFPRWRLLNRSGNEVSDVARDEFGEEK